MNQAEDDFDPAEGDDIQLEKALVEYANSMDDEGRSRFMEQLKADPAYFTAMGNALSEMAALIAGAAVINDDVEFSKLRKRILFNARQDADDVKTLRLYYLDNRHAVDMESVMSGSQEARERLEQRLEAFAEDYRQQHPA